MAFIFIKNPLITGGFLPHINRQVRPDYNTVIVEPINVPSIRNTPFDDFHWRVKDTPFISPSATPKDASPADALPADSKPQ